MTHKRKPDRKPKGLVVTEPSRSPQHVHKDIWYYEDRRGIHVVVSGEYFNGKTISFRIPWGRLRKSLARCKPKP